MEYIWNCFCKVERMRNWLRGNFNKGDLFWKVIFLSMFAWKIISFINYNVGGILETIYACINLFLLQTYLKGDLFWKVCCALSEQRNVFFLVSLLTKLYLKIYMLWKFNLNNFPEPKEIWENKTFFLWHKWD